MCNNTRIWWSIGYEIHIFLCIPFFTAMSYRELNICCSLLYTTNAQDNLQCLFTEMSGWPVPGKLVMAVCTYCERRHCFVYLSWRRFFRCELVLHSSLCMAFWHDLIRVEKLKYISFYSSSDPNIRHDHSILLLVGEVALLDLTSHRILYQRRPPIRSLHSTSCKFYTSCIQPDVHNSHGWIMNRCP